MQYDVFISHSSADLAVSEKLFEYLEANGIKCWIDTKNVTGLYARSIIEGIKQSQIMVVVFSGHSNVSPHVENEVDNAFNERKVIIPFRIEDIEMSDVLKYYLRKSHYVDGFLDPVAAFPELKEHIISNLPEKRKEKDFLDALTLIALQKGISIEKIQRLIDNYTSGSKEEFDKLLQDIKNNDLDKTIINEENININTDDEQNQKRDPIEIIKNQIINVNNVEFKMISVDGGTFDMGSENSDCDVYPVHKVTLSNYYIGETPVTQELWCAVMENNPSFFKNKYFPVENVSWVDCIEFIEKLNVITGRVFRLPTEAEWEYAARGGKYRKGYTYSGSNNINKVAWWKGNSEKSTHLVKTKLPNELGIYDMSGNVWEWCNDNSAAYSKEAVTNPHGPIKESSKVQRGGCWDGQLLANKDSCKVTYRSSDFKTYSSKRIGFRLAMSTSNTKVTENTWILPNTFKLTIAGKDIYMLLSANKEYYIGNILDVKSDFKWVNTNSGICVKDIIITGATISAIAITPIFSLCATILYWILASDKDTKINEVLIDENFCNAISGDYKFSIPNADELKDVKESEKSHCFVLRLCENPKFTELLSLQQ